MILKTFPKNVQFEPPTIRHKRVSMTIVCTPFLSAGVGWRGCASYQIFKKGGLDRISIFREGLLVKRVVTFCRGLAVFT